MDMCLSIAHFFMIKQLLLRLMHRKKSPSLQEIRLFQMNNPAVFKRLHKLLVIS
jgi:hypothetical protein